MSALVYAISQGIVRYLGEVGLVARDMEKSCLTLPKWQRS
jgi:hypothetical protein